MMGVLLLVCCRIGGYFVAADFPGEGGPFRFTREYSNLGAGWGAWCREYLAKNGGAQADEEEEDYPNGSGFNGHARLPISGMPAPREADHDDVDNLVYDQTTSHVIEQ